MEETHRYKKARHVMEMSCIFGTCSKCTYLYEGIGIHKVVVYDVYEVDSKIDCEFCFGGSKSEECSTCDGTGECPDCSGSGTHHAQCDKCKGQGKAWDDNNGIKIGSEVVLE